MSNDSTKNQRLYLIITFNGYWGKGETPEEAAKNCHIRSKWESGQLTYADQDYIDGEAYHGGYGSSSWSWREKWYKRDDFRQVLEPTLIKALQRTGEFRFYKGKLEFKETITE
jgi:hypothetical protein